MFKVNYSKVMWLALFFPIIVTCGRYDFLLFENFEVTKKSFVTEQKLARNLRVIRQVVYYRLNELNNNVHNRFYFQNMGHISLKMEQNLQYGIHFYLKYIYNFPYYKNKSSIDQFY